MAFGDITLTVIGNLTGDPELRFTTSGTPVAVFTVASNPKEWDKTTNSYRDVDPSFVRVECWRNLAENVAESLTKGTRVIASGRWRERHWENDKGEKRSSWTLTADAVGPDLTFVSIKPEGLRKSTRHADTPADDPWATGSKTRPEPAAAGTSGGFSDDPPF